MDQFIEAMWLMKNKKFDTWYELCIGSTVHNKIKDIVSIDLKFDNGS